MLKKGAIFGRFQVIHLKQMEYILAAKMRCNKLFIGISHPDIISFAATSSLDIHGIRKRDNPLTYFERYEMILIAMEEFGVKREDYEIIPFPISQPDLLLQYAPSDAIYYLNVSTPWDAERLHILESLGLKTEVLWRKSNMERGITGSAVRSIIAEDGEWEQFVPKGVCSYMKEHKIDHRIQILNRFADEDEQ